MARAVVPRAASSAVVRWVAIAGFALIVLPAAAGEDSPAAALVRRLALPAPAITRFVEVRYSALLTRPLSTAGELEYRGPRLLYKRILAPYHEQQVIDGDRVTVEREGEKVRRFSLQRAPELKGILDSLGSLLAGDAHELERVFEVSVEQGTAGWVLRLAPRSSRARQQLRDILVSGRAGQVDCFVIDEPDGDASFMLLGEASEAKLPEPPLRAWLQEHCRVPGG